MHEDAGPQTLQRPEQSQLFTVADKGRSYPVHLGLAHFQFRISGRSSPCFSM